MSRRARTHLLALGLVCGCADDSADDAGGMCQGDPATIIPGELIEWIPFGHDFSEFCPGGFDIAEGHAHWVAQAWGAEALPFRFGLFESNEEPCWPCPSYAGACVVSHDTASTELPDRHEIAHSVRADPCFPLIEEGWAMLYGDHFTTASTEGDIRVALQETGMGLPGTHYPIAARFVAFLLETRGVAKVRELCGIKVKEPTQFEAAVLETYGVTFDDLANEFDSYPEWHLGQLVQDRACESADVLVGPTSWDFALDCDGPGIEGKTGAAFETQRLIEIPVEGIYQFIFESDIELELRVELRSCAREGMASTFYYNPYGGIRVENSYGLLLLDPYPAGVYVVRVRVIEPTGPVDLHMSLAPWP